MKEKWIEINLAQIRANAFNLKKALKPKTKLLAVVKSEAYGHGLIPVSQAIAEIVDYFGVNDVEEGCTLREAGIKKPILVMGGTLVEDFAEAIKKDLTLTVYSKEMIQTLSAQAVKLKKPVKIHLKVDTGMRRYGIEPDQVLDFIQIIRRSPKLELEGLYSHFVSAESRDKTPTFKQLGIFQTLINKINQTGIELPLKHIANSAAALSMESTHLDMVRCGITLYGLFPNPELGSFFDLKPALSYKTRIVQIKKVGGSEKVGYGWTYTTSRPTLLGVIPVGYADGLDRHLSNLEKVLVGGKRVPIVGKICMNASIIDLTDVSEAKTGDEVVIIGQQGHERITIGEIAGYLGTITYEIVTRLPDRIPRIYLK